VSTAERTPVLVIWPTALATSWRARVSCRLDDRMLMPHVDKATSAVATGWPSWRGFLTRAFHPDRPIMPWEPPANPRQLRIPPHRDDRAREREDPSEALLREAPQQLFPETRQRALAVCWGLERQLEILVDVLSMFNVLHHHRPRQAENKEPCQAPAPHHRHGHHLSFRSSSAMRDRLSSSTPGTPSRALTLWSAHMRSLRVNHCAGAVSRVRPRAHNLR